MPEFPRRVGQSVAAVASAASEDDAGQLADAVDNLPLALTQAASYLQETGLTAQAYLQLLTRRATAILAQRGARDLPGAG